MQFIYLQVINSKFTSFEDHTLKFDCDKGKRTYVRNEHLCVSVNNILYFNVHNNNTNFTMNGIKSVHYILSIEKITVTKPLEEFLYISKL